MQYKLFVPLLAAGIATVSVALLQPSKSVSAGGGNGASIAETDTDGDFLPDAVEWVVLTNPTNPDTDGDQSPDFVEVVENGRPRHESAPLPPDHAMRLVITGPTPGSTDTRTWMHVFFRVQAPQGAPVTSIQSFAVYLESPLWPGLQVPVNMLAAGNPCYRERLTANHGAWIQLSVPLVNQSVLASVLPCTIWAEAQLTGDTLRSGVKLVPIPEGIGSLVPFGDGRFVLQTLSPIPSTVANPPESNRVCILTLEEDSTGPAGTTYVVVDADCEDANDLECSSSCTSSIGSLITIPGGAELIAGN